MSVKLHLYRPGTVAPYCGIRSQEGLEHPKGTEDKAKFWRIAKNPEATFQACGRCQRMTMKP